MLKVKEVSGIYKIWSGKDWCFLCERDEKEKEYRDLEFDTYEEAEKRIEQIRDHQATIDGEMEWEDYCNKWNIEEV